MGNCNGIYEPDYKTNLTPTHPGGQNQGSTPYENLAQYKKEIWQVDNIQKSARNYVNCINDMDSRTDWSIYKNSTGEEIKQDLRVRQSDCFYGEKFLK